MCNLVLNLAIIYLVKAIISLEGIQNLLTKVQVIIFWSIFKIYFV